MVDSLRGVHLVTVQKHVEEDLKHEHDNATTQHHNMVELTVSERKKKANRATLMDAQVIILLFQYTPIKWDQKDLSHLAKVPLIQSLLRSDQEE